MGEKKKKKYLEGFIVPLIVWGSSTEYGVHFKNNNFIKCN